MRSPFPHSQPTTRSSALIGRVERSLRPEQNSENTELDAVDAVLLVGVKFTFPFVCFNNYSVIVKCRILLTAVSRLFHQILTPLCFVSQISSSFEYLFGVILLK